MLPNHLESYPGENQFSNLLYPLLRLSHSPLPLSPGEQMAAEAVVAMTAENKQQL